MRVFVLLVLSFFLGSYSPINAQESGAYSTQKRVSSTVRIENQSNGKPVLNAFIYGKKNDHSVMTDSTGTFSLDSFSLSDTLIIKHPAYQPRVVSKNSIVQNNGKVVLEEKRVKLDEFVFVAFKTRGRQADIPFKIQAIHAEDILNEQAQTSADLLQSRGNVLIQKSQQGGGSPIIRGFEANRVLLVVDGIRMNNAIYRSGHLQNVVTLDNNMMDRVEVLFGPASVSYGSDALGGVIHFYSKKPAFSTSDTLNFQLNAFSRYSTVNNEQAIHANINLGTKKLAFLGGVTHTSFGDLRMGSLRQSDYPDFGKVPFYAGIHLGEDTMLVNSDPNVHKNTGYNQTDANGKLSYQLGKKSVLGLNVQYSTSSDIPRFDRLNELRDGKLRRAEWYYGPQNRFLSALTFEAQPENKIMDAVQFVAAFQSIDESRRTRSFGSDIRTLREEAVDVYSFNADFQKKRGENQQFQYGLELLWNDVASQAKEINIRSLEEGLATSRYPDGGSTMGSFAAYVGYRKDLNENAILHTGVRYNRTVLESNFSDTTFYTLPFEKIDYNIGAFTGSIGLVYRPWENWQVDLATSSGFRSPNVDDVGKIFDNDDRVIIPSAEVKPEYAYSGEVSLIKSLHKERLRLTGTFFYTFIQDLIVRKDAALNGQDSLDYEGETLKIQVNTNANNAVIYGYSLGFFARVGSHFSLESNYNFTSGKDLSDDISLGHIPPVYGKTSLSYNIKKLSGSLSSFYNGWKRIEDFAPSGVDNDDEATIDGSPSWYTVNLSNAYQMTDNFTLRFAIKNIFDRHYKPFASGISGPGRNFVFSVQATLK